METIVCFMEENPLAVRAMSVWCYKSVVGDLNNFLFCHRVVWEENDGSVYCSFCPVNRLSFRKASEFKCANVCQLYR